jgi:hypothetical protein
MIRMTVDMKGVGNLFTDAATVTKDLTDDAYTYFVAQTPVRSGNARRSTSLSSTKDSKTGLSKATIEGNYAYAQRLDDGYSQQAPTGMTGPTERYIERRLNELVRKIK